MSDQIIDAVADLAASPWVFAALFGISALDSFFPVVPSETLVITLGAFSASKGDPNVVLTVLVTALGAFVGDHISYYIGRHAGTRVFTRLREGSRTKRAYDRVGGILADRGGLVLVVARYIPGGRTAATLSMGATAYPRRLFTRYDAVAVITWAVYSTGLGYLGGSTFEDSPLLGVGLGLGIAFTVTMLHEGIRLLRNRWRAKERA